MTAFLESSFFEILVLFRLMLEEWVNGTHFSDYVCCLLIFHNPSCLLLLFYSFLDYSRWEIGRPSSLKKDVLEQAKSGSKATSLSLPCPVLLWLVFRYSSGLLCFIAWSLTLSFAHFAWIPFLIMSIPTSRFCLSLTERFPCKSSQNERMHERRYVYHLCS